jgi:hypothetical protein
MIRLSVTLNDGRVEEVEVRGIPLRLFEQAAQAMERKDEFGLIALAIDRPRQWVIEHVAPDSLAALAAAMQQENAAFFAWYARRCLLGLTPAEMLQLQRALPSDSAIT